MSSSSEEFGDPTEIPQLNRRVRNYIFYLQPTFEHENKHKTDKLWHLMKSYLKTDVHGIER